MNINIDCFRDTLKYIADNIRYVDLQGSITTQSVDLNMLYSSNELQKYDNMDIMYSIMKLEECRFIHIESKYPPNKPYVERCSIDDVTFSGHQFIESVKEPTVWEKTKSIAGKVGNHTIQFIESVAHDVAVESAKQVISIAMSGVQIPYIQSD